MRICLMYGDYPPKPEGKHDGGADFVQALAERLVTRGHSVSVLISMREGRQNSYETTTGVRVIPLVRDWTLRGAMRGQLTLLKGALAAEGADVVHLIYPDPYLRYESDSYHLPFLLKVAGVQRLVVTFFGFAVTGASAVTRLGLLSLFASSDRIVITDRALLGRFQRTFPFWARKARSGFVGSIADSNSSKWSLDAIARRRDELGLPRGERLVAFFGFWSPDKGLEDLIEAMGRLRAEGEPVTLLLVGGREPSLRTDYERKIARAAADLLGQGAVIETGRLSTEEVERYLVAVDVCALPFHVNPLGRSSLAVALSLGVPTVVSRPSDGEELLNGVAMSEAGDPDSLVAAIRGVLDNSIAQIKAGEAALKASMNWGWDSITDAYLADYRALDAKR